MREQIEARTNKADSDAPIGKETAKPETPAPASVTYSKKTVLAILNTPFHIGESITGYSRPIPKELEPVLAETGEQILKDFGAEISMKWLNLAVFGAVYGGCIFTYFQGVGELRRKQIAEQKKRQDRGKNEIEEHHSNRHQG